MLEDLVQVFLEESQEILEQLEEDLLKLEHDQADEELMAGIFRAAHTIKGSAGLTGLDDISHLAHRLEDVLDQVRSDHKVMSRGCFETVFQTVDMLNKMVAGAAGGELVNPDEVELMTERLTFFLSEDTPLLKAAPDSLQQTKTGDRIYRAKLKFRDDFFESGTDPLKLILELAEKGEVLEANTRVSTLPVFSEIDPFKLYLSWTLVIRSSLPISELEEIFIFVFDDNEILIEDITNAYDITNLSDKKTGEIMVDDGIIEHSDLEENLKKQKKIGELLVEDHKVTRRQVEHVVEKQQAGRKCEQVTTIRVDTKRLENVLNFIAELVISHSRVKELACKQSDVEEEVFTAFQEVDKIIRRLQEEVMKTSMVPIGGTFTRFQRMVRDLAAEQGKEVELIISGQETELDKRVIEQITDPLKHMIRNSLDHGIEMPDVREANGKPRGGKIHLNAFHQEGSIAIEITDDGKGLDVDAIYRKALNKGLVEENIKLSKEEMLNFIMQPGFSTAQQVTDISGRGVGLDVVATNIQQLRGTLDVETTQGEGTRFAIKLPLTLAIIDGMMVTVGEERFILPLTSIVEFIKARPEDIKTVEGTGRVVNMRNEYLALAALHSLLGLQAAKTDPTEGILVIIRDNRKKIALLVDDILGQEQVVTKSMKENYEQVEGVAGATIMGDGRVAIILDVPTLIKMAGR